MDIYSIYKITNKINNKVYIGFDSSWPRRLAEHKQSSKTKRYKFYNAVRKYGWINFESEVIYQSLDGKHCKNVMEPYFIQEYDSYINGYNSTKGGDGVLGWKHTEQYKIDKGHKFKIIKPNGSETIIQNLRIFCEINGLDVRKMSDVSRGLYSQHKGYKCEPLESSTISKRQQNLKIKHNKQSVTKFKVIDPNGKQYNVTNLMAFCKEHNLHYNTFRKVLKGLRHQYKNWKVSYYDEYKEHNVYTGTKKPYQ